MPFPTITDLADRLYGQAIRAQDPAQDELRDYPLAKLTGALLDDADWAATALEPDGDDPAGGRLLDPDETPAGWVRWLGQFHGVRVTKGAPEAVQRDEVRTAAGRKRGRRSSMIADVKRTLTGTRTVGIVAVSRWRITFRTVPGETPDPAVTLRAALGQKPYGIVLTHVVTDSPLWDEAAASWDDMDAGVAFDAVEFDDVTGD